MLQRLSRLRIGKGREPARAAPTTRLERELRTAVARERLRLTAELHDEAAATVSTTLHQMAELHRRATARNPDLDLAPYLTAYFETARASLLRNTLSILADTTAATSPPTRPKPRVMLPHWPRPRLLPRPSRHQTTTREDHSDGTA